MDKSTKIELLKILGMIIILVALIWGIVWMNSDHTSEDINNTATNESESAGETNSESINENEVVEGTTDENATNEGENVSEDNTSGVDDTNVTTEGNESETETETDN